MSDKEELITCMTKYNDYLRFRDNTNKLMNFSLEINKLKK